MNADAIEAAVTLLVEARRTGKLIDRLPDASSPSTVDEAHAIQDATIARLNEGVAGWKVGTPIDGHVVRGTLLRSRTFASGATIRPSLVPMLGIEAEIAFRFDRDLPPRSYDYDYDEVADAVTAFAAIEIVDSRFRDHAGTPLFARIADFVSNGAFVFGTPQPRWRELDLTKIVASLEFDGQQIVRCAGGHPTGDPLLPAVALVNDFARRAGVRAGVLVTTGTYTGLNHAKPGQMLRATFEDFGFAEVKIASG